MSTLPSGVILAGGVSRRMGRDKALLALPDGRTLLARTIATLRAAGLGEVALSVSTLQRGAALQTAEPVARGLRLVPDAQHGLGPLAGLQAALSAYPGSYLLLVAVDMPYLDDAALSAMIAEPCDADALVPHVAGWAQPLMARYGPACLPVAERLIAEGRLAMRDLLTAPELRVRYLDEAWLARVGSSPHAFANLNTPDALAALASGDHGQPAHG